ncbi:MAG: hypothetical protein V1660_01090 [archaeon]
MSSDLIKLIKKIEKERDCACDIDVNIVKNGVYASEKYGNLDNRKIKLNKIARKYREDITKDLKLLKDIYHSVKELKDCLGKNNLLLKYHVLKDGIYLKTPGIHGGFLEGIGDKIASIEYDRLK